MKLWVVGETTPDPSEWSIWSEFAIVVAETADEARDLVHEHEGWAPAEVTEIPMDKAQVLVKMQEPNMGEDI